MTKKLSLFVLTVLILMSCSKDDEINEEDNLSNNNNSGVVLTFDDNYIDDWTKTDKILEPYHWKATFYITKMNLYTTDEIKELKDFENEGHEIGAHGYNHYNAPSFIEEFGAKEYLNQEILPMLDFIDKYNFNTSTFAYPYGARKTECDNLLLDKFSILRGTTYGNPNPENHNCYYNNNRIIYGLGLDNSYSHFSVPYYLSLLKYAKKNNKIVIFYAHKTVATVANNYETENKTLISICEFVTKNHMKFYTTSQLYKLSI